MKPVYIVGIFHEETESGSVWDFCGVYNNRYDAENRCTTPSHFVGPANMNEELSDEQSLWKDSYYPFTDGRKTPKEEAIEKKTIFERSTIWSGSVGGRSAPSQGQGTGDIPSGHRCR